MNLVGGDRRSPEQGESYMSERPVLWRACSPVLTLHHAVIRRRATERDSISFVVGAHASEGAAPSNSSREVVNMGGLRVWPGRLIMAAIFVQPRNCVGRFNTVRRGVAVLRIEAGDPWGHRDSRSR